MHGRSTSCSEKQCWSNDLILESLQDLDSEIQLSVNVSKLLMIEKFPRYSSQREKLISKAKNMIFFHRQEIIAC